MLYSVYYWEITIEIRKIVFSVLGTYPFVLLKNILILNHSHQKIELPPEPIRHSFWVYVVFIQIFGVWEYTIVHLLH